MRSQVIWFDSAARQPAKLDRPVAKRISEQVTGLETDLLRKLRRVVGAPHYRLRVGDYRVIVEAAQSQLRVLVLKVGQRSAVYPVD